MYGLEETVSFEYVVLGQQPANERYIIPFFV